MHNRRIMNRCGRCGTPTYSLLLCTECRSFFQALARSERGAHSPEVPPMRKSTAQPAKGEPRVPRFRKSS